MAKNVQLKVDEPCSADWGQMRAEDQGRFCGSCQKTVVDFTLMTDQQMLDWLAAGPKSFASKGATTGGSTCGRFTADQLNRQLLPARQPPRLSLWQWVLAALLLSSEAKAQTRPAKPPIVQLDSSATQDIIVGGYVSEPTTRPTARRKLPDTLRGSIVDVNGGTAVPFATITAGTQHFMADKDGFFSIPGSALSNRKELTINIIGYEAQVVEVSRYWHSDQRALILVKMVQTVLGKIEVVGVKTRRQTAEDILNDTLAAIKDTLGLSKKTLAVYPNPVVRGGSVTLTLRLDEQGTYMAQLFNTAGVLEETMEIVPDQSSKTVLMTIPPTAVPGTYFIRLSNPALRKPYTQTLVVL